jgi:molybdopterin molybdotransferase
VISFQDAIKAIETHVELLPVESRELADLDDTASAAALISCIDVPAFNNAAMDGFALRARDTRLASKAKPIQLDIAGVTAAGDPPAVAPPEQAAVEIMTGAPMPADCDAVIPIERVETDSTDDNRVLRIRIDSPLEAGRNVRTAGEDFLRGANVLPTGVRIAPQHVMALAATGNDRIEVRRQPRVAIVTTGSELADRGSPQAPGMIRDANGPYLESAIARCGAVATTRTNVADQLEALTTALDSQDAADVIVTTGGVSAGRYDLIPQAVTQLGGEIIFHKVAIRPGKPLLFARLPSGKWLFGLPGNPIAAAVGLRFFVAPALLRLQGLPAETFHTAISDDPIRKRSDMYFFGKASAFSDADGRLHVRLLPGQESFRIAPLSRANCWAIVPDGRADIAAGDLVQIAPLYPVDFLQT